MRCYICLFLLSGHRGGDREFTEGELAHLRNSVQITANTVLCVYVCVCVRCMCVLRKLNFTGSQAGLRALLAVAEHAGEFDKIIELSQR